MSTSVRFLLLLAFATGGLAGCARDARLRDDQDTGPQPVLAEPDKALVPTIEIAEATGWPAGATPTAAPGLAVQAFATGLEHPRWLHVLPNGDVLVAETNGPPGKSAFDGIKGALMNAAMKKAGAAVPSPNRITLLRDADGDGVAEQRSTFLQGLNSPFGMALVGATLYVANADALLRFPYRAGDTAIAASGTQVIALPGGGEELNHHWTKSLLASADGARLYVGVGSNSNIAEKGLAAETERAAVLEVDPARGTRRVFASGMRNPVGLAWGPDGALWAVVNERDELGDDLVPDYLTRVEPGAFYGWPWSYYGGHVDTRVTPARPDMAAKARVPDFALGAHVAPLGLAIGEGLGAGFGAGAYVGLHGSWNRQPLNGYEVVFVQFDGPRAQGPVRTVLGGFVDAQGQARGRPVGVVFGRDGALLVADDVGNVIWRVAPVARRAGSFD
jgi:glucose/arabinose dehydrogenase